MLKSKYFALIGSSVFVSGASVLVYELRKPRNIKDVAEWKGIKLAKEDDDFVWKALLFQKKEEKENRERIRLKEVLCRALLKYKLRQ